MDGGPVFEVGAKPEPAGRPEWEPDHAAQRCRGCAALFTMSNRRHHCRKCGKIFCNACCASMLPLPELHYDEPVRVCTHCARPPWEAQLLQSGVGAGKPVTPKKKR